MKLIRILFFLFVICSYPQGGMWIPSNLEGSIEEQMQAMGSRLSAEQIYSLNQSSLKDAIGHFNGNCTSSVISSTGLILTNHHCGESQIQSHSSVENDYLKHGFWAESPADELPNEGLYVDFIISIHDVTDAMFAGLSEIERTKLTQAEINSRGAKIANNWSHEVWQRTAVKSFFDGNAYYLFVSERYEDVRLVGAPPSSIGKFGNDTDNWVYPRHAGDFSLFRIYADKNNRPATYSEDNVPYKPKHYLPISLDGISEDDFTLVFGFPGTTSEYLPSVAIEHIMTDINPTGIAIRDASLGVIDKYMMANDTIRIQYASKQSRIANSWKRWKGELLGFEKVDLVNIKKLKEQEFLERLKKENLEDKYGHILPEFNRLYTDYAAINLKRRKFLELFIYNNELLNLMFSLNGIVRASERGSNAFDAARDRFLELYSNKLKDFNPKVDKDVFLAIAPFYLNEVDVSIYETTAFTDMQKGRELLQDSLPVVIENIKQDPAYALVEPYIEDYFNSVYPKFQELNSQIGAVQQQYMAALVEVFKEDRFFPDANSTLRVSFGKV